MRILLLITLCLFWILSSSQNANRNFFVDINYGINGNFFVRSYTEQNLAGFGQSFYNKNFIGTIGGIDLAYSLSERTTIGLGYSRSVNTRSINFLQTGSPIFVQDFTISHKNDFYQLLLTRKIGKITKGFSLEGGAYYLRSAQQEVDISPFSAAFEERNFKNSRLEELGAVIGFQYKQKVDAHLYFGLRTRFYFTLSTGAPELIAFTPILAYQF